MQSTGARMTLDFDLNGRATSLQIEPHETLAEVLREKLGLTGCKLSCEVQVCGACTVLVDGQPVSACTSLAYEARGKSVVSIEGLASPDGSLHPLQQAFLDEFGFQCGFCTPGMILAVKALLRETPQPSDAETRHYLRGNLCRCTGYSHIIDAVAQAARSGSEVRRG